MGVKTERARRPDRRGDGESVETRRAWRLREGRDMEGMETEGVEKERGCRQRGHGDLKGVKTERAWRSGEHGDREGAESWTTRR